MMSSPGSGCATGCADTMKAFGALSTAATASKAIDTKMKELMALAIGIAVHCDGCVAYHTKMAHQHGATREEVPETIALAVYMAADRPPSMVPMRREPMTSSAENRKAQRGPS